MGRLQTMFLKFSRCVSYLNQINPNYSFVLVKGNVDVTAEKLRTCLLLFFVFKNKNIKNMFRKSGIFLFFVFSMFSKTTFLR